MPVTLDNGRLRAEFDPLGAQLISLQDARGTQYIWHADPALWGRHAPNLFPVIGRLKDGQYTLAGETYSIPPHGFARDSVFTVAGQTDTSVSFRLTDTEETRAVYPFSFVLTIAYSLEENCLLKSCTVENPSDRVLLYELGGHDGYRVPLEAGETMADYAIRLPGVEELKPYGMDPTGLITPQGGLLPSERGTDCPHPLRLRPGHRHSGPPAPAPGQPGGQGGPGAGSGGLPRLPLSGALDPGQAL